jgi:hypothetical protein
VVPDLAAFYTVNVLLRLRASVRIRSRRKGVDAPFLTDDSTGLGTRFELLDSRGERSADPSTVIGLWASYSDNGDSRAAEEHCKDSDSELEGSEDSVHQVGSA